MKSILMIACLFFSSSLFGGDCVKNLRGETICSNGKTAVAVNPNTGNAAVAHKNPNGVTTTQASNGATAKTTNGVAVAQGPNGAAAVNTHTGNAAVAHTNSNGVTTTQTSNGGKAKTSLRITGSYSSTVGPTRCSPCGRIRKVGGTTTSGQPRKEPRYHRC
jgi:hypothetical protein